MYYNFENVYALLYFIILLYYIIFYNNVCIKKCELYSNHHVYTVLYKVNGNNLLLLTVSFSVIGAQVQ